MQVSGWVAYPGIGTLVRSDLSNLRTLFHALEVLEPDFDLVPLSLEETLDDVVELLRNREEAANCSVCREPGDRNTRIFGDRDRLIQVFLNVGINALQAGAGGRSVRVGHTSRKPASAAFSGWPLCTGASPADLREQARDALRCRNET